jgi:hypothetical protein
MHSVPDISVPRNSSRLPDLIDRRRSENKGSLLGSHFTKHIVEQHRRRFYRVLKQIGYIRLKMLISMASLAPGYNT